ncbi:MFS transporter, putative [Talaromyces stipitatus ATCC 10500]|uniref:MFS transporter, putative n=1 Tax=Talaromyces stipitatus (strain ATCC 10500 / CBS 375.48 / QM 6759 / NRRL 1006) TaxID=441959 RepID=B8M635_TALSN|nr:MFS transporter, putative [Talaromyces stipitatus ATCC 10500]EED19035.1 MFS transporter, putative [Talaromyces stipitatus ATCC 10500]
MEAFKPDTIRNGFAASCLVSLDLQLVFQKLNSGEDSNATRQFIMILRFKIHTIILDSCNARRDRLERLVHDSLPLAQENVDLRTGFAQEYLKRKRSTKKIVHQGSLNAEEARGFIAMPLRVPSIARTAVSGEAKFWGGVQMTRGVCYLREWASGSHRSEVGPGVDLGVSEASVPHHCEHRANTPRGTNQSGMLTSVVLGNRLSYYSLPGHVLHALRGEACLNHRGGRRAETDSTCVVTKGKENSLSTHESLEDADNLDKTAIRKLVWKQDLRIVPLSAFIYLLCYLDRSNIGNAKILNSDTHNDLLTETHMTNYQYTVALMVFLIAYALFEVPSNYLLKKLRPSRWIAFLMLSWGAITMGLGGAKNNAQVTGIRFILGVFEAVSERSIRVALILASATLAGAFGGAIAYGVGHLNQSHGLSAWRWLFIIEGAPSCFSALLIFFLLPDYPETSHWLSAQEKDLAKRRLRVEGSQGHAKGMTWEDAKSVLTEWRLYAHYAVYFGISTPFSSLSLFTPSITAGLGYEGLRAQLMTVPPYAVAYVVTIAVAGSADYFNARGIHSAIFSFIGAMGFLASAVLPPDAYQHRYGCLIVAASGSFSCIPPLLGWLSSNLNTTASAGLAIALNISFGAPGQIAGVWIYKSSEAKKGYPTGHWTNAGLLLFVTVGCILLQIYYMYMNKRLRRLPGSKLYAY